MRRLQLVERKLDKNEEIKKRYEQQIDTLLKNGLQLQRTQASATDSQRGTDADEREALRAIMSLFDPLGLATPITIQAKKILQETWRTGIDWDTELQPREADAWRSWMDHVRRLSALEVPRCYPEVATADTAELHTFVDASSDAYAFGPTLQAKYPVVIFIHGESFEWNSGNVYDGAVLASYAGIVVITINYRLGILGFLNANPIPHLKARVANYGLMDQIAALHWIQQNIALFGGDAGNVTMLGHGSGAACINFLMISPTVMPGLFQRAILLSGSALSSWALVEDPVSYSVQLAKQSNCTLPEDIVKDHELIVDCLREVPLEELMSAEINTPSYLTAFGPSVDGVVVKTDYAKELLTFFIPNDLQGFTSVSGVNNFKADKRSGDRIFGIRGGQNKYDLLFGVVTSEALWKFSAQDIQNGFEGERRDRIIRTYVRNAYTYHLSEIFFTIVNEYTDWERTVQHPINTRDAAVLAISDAQYVAPLVQTGDFLSVAKSSPDSGPNTFFYVFDYQTKDGDYPQRMGSVHGEELPYLFGAPLVDGLGHFPKNYTKSEVALSEAFILYMANFVRTG
ncbi:neuroligin-3-like, partial [Galleria mellonella]|uniref:Neuroligin-3-like n=1 Tax=Galleria mellonella TaxID=7137 RepID=A0ABM3MJZ2_GALME